jgi:hypothetical protein
MFISCSYPLFGKNLSQNVSCKPLKLLRSKGNKSGTVLEITKVPHADIDYLSIDGIRLVKSIRIKRFISQEAGDKISGFLFL